MYGVPRIKTGLNEDRVQSTLECGEFSPLACPEPYLSEVEGSKGTCRATVVSSLIPAIPSAVAVTDH